MLAMERREILRREPLTPPVTASICDACRKPMPSGRKSIRCSDCHAESAREKHPNGARKRMTQAEGLKADGIILEVKAWRPCLAEDHDHLIYTTKNVRLCEAARRHYSQVVDSSPSLTVPTLAFAT